VARRKHTVFLHKITIEEYCMGRGSTVTSLSFSVPSSIMLEHETYCRVLVCKMNRKILICNITEMILDLGILLYIEHGFLMKRTRPGSNHGFLEKKKPKNCGWSLNMSASWQSLKSSQIPMFCLQSTVGQQTCGVI
jgi:hypothetical protein